MGSLVLRKPRVCQRRAAGHTFATLDPRITFLGPQDVTQDQGKRKTGQHSTCHLNLVSTRDDNLLQGVDMKRNWRSTNESFRSVLAESTL